MGKKFAVPTQNGVLCQHFGHCEKFAIVETEENQITNQYYLEPPVHQPGSYPRFLAENQVNNIIAGGMGIKAQNLFTQNNIEVCVGVASQPPEKLVDEYLKGKLQTGQNLCDH